MDKEQVNDPWGYNNVKPGDKWYPAKMVPVSEVVKDALKIFDGCFKGCYYYTDSCFRKDCKKKECKR